MEIKIPVHKLIRFIEAFRGKDGNFPAIKISILLHLHKSKSCYVQDVVEQMNATRPSAQRHLTSLVVAGVVAKNEVYEGGKYKNQFTLTREGQELVKSSLNTLE